MLNTDFLSKTYSASTGVKPNDIRGWLSGKRKIPDWLTEESLTK
jgi:hypothetical protein